MYLNDDDPNPILRDLIVSVLKEVLPQFDPNQVDRKMVSIAVHDVRNFLKHSWNVEDDILFGSIFIKKLTEEGVSFKDELRGFLGLWFKKWKERVKLIFNEEQWDKNYETVSMLVQRGERKVPFEQIKLFKFPVIEYLISRGELCCTEELSDQSIKRKGADLKGHLTTPKEKIEFLNKVFTLVRSYSDCKGPLIFIKVSNDLVREAY